MKMDNPTYLLQLTKGRHYNKVTAVENENQISEEAFFAFRGKKEWRCYRLQVDKDSMNGKFTKN